MQTNVEQERPQKSSSVNGPPPIPKIASLNRVDEVEAAKRQITNLIAAGVIADVNFPHEKLPRVASLPFTTLAHQVLFDYERCVRLVWSVALELKQDFKLLRRWANGLLVGSALLGTLIGIVVEDLTRMTGWATVAGLLAWFGGYALARSFLVSSRIARRTLARRADAVEKLLQDRFEEPPSIKFADCPPNDCILWGAADIAGPELPVIISRESERFPGFGRAVNEQSLVCPRSKHSENDLPSPAAYRSAVIEAAVAAAERTKFGPIRSGPVILADAASIQWNSPLILRGCPRPTIRPDELNDDDGGIIGADCRLYTATMLIFPQYLTTATLFLRPYLSGRCACCEVTLVLLGPPVATQSLLRNRVRRLRNAASGQKPPLFGESKVNEFGPWAKRLASLRGAITNEISHVRVPERTWATRDPKHENGLMKVSQTLAQETDHWIGEWAFVPDQREYQSYVLTPDVFGRMEVRAALRGLYLQVSDAILTAIEDLGFDVDSYRDEKGKLTISATSIDSLVVGERITMRAPEAPSVAEKPAEKSPAKEKQKT